MCLTSYVLYSNADIRMYLPCTFILATWLLYESSYNIVLSCTATLQAMQFNYFYKLHCQHDMPTFKANALCAVGSLHTGAFISMS